MKKTKTVQVRVDNILFQELEYYATQDARTVSGFIRNELKKTVEKKKNHPTTQTGKFTLND
jgi:hypothetical protein